MYEGRAGAAQEDFEFFAEQIEKEFGASSPAALNARRTLAECLVRQGKHNEALRILDEIVNAFPRVRGVGPIDLPQTKLLLGVTHLQLGNAEKGRVFISEAKEALIAARGETFPQSVLASAYEAYVSQSQLSAESARLLRAAFGWQPEHDELLDSINKSKPPMRNRVPILF
jgi:tetratricopeptide (TPR) repeat protein